MTNWLFKYSYDFDEIYGTRTKNLLASIYILLCFKLDRYNYDNRIS